VETIRATVEKVEHDIGTGWYRISTDHASVKRLDTKKTELAEQAAELKRSGAQAEISYNERVVNKDGRTYRNYYYENGVPASGNGSGIETIQPQQQGRKTDPGEAWRIALSVGAKLAVETLPLMAPEQRSFETQKKIALAWASFVFYTPLIENPGAALAYAQTAPEPDPEWGSPPPEDEDIPF